MTSCRILLSAGAVALAAFFAPSGVSAMPLGVGAGSAAHIAADPLVLNVQHRPNRARPGARPMQRSVTRHSAGGVRHAAPHRVNRSRTVRRNVATGVAVGATLGVIGAVAAAQARPRYVEHHYAPVHRHATHHGFQPAAHHYYARPACVLRNEPLFDRHGVYRGTFRIQICN